MKRRLTAIVLTLAIICGLFSALTFSVSASVITPTYWAYDGENLTKQPSFDEDTFFIFANGADGDTYALPDVFYHEIALVTNNVAVTIPEHAELAMIAISGTGSIIRDNLTITNANTTAFTGNANNGNDVKNFYFGNDEFYCFSYSGNTTLSFDPRIGAIPDDPVYQINVDGNLTVDCILNAIEVNVSGNLFIKAPADGDPNGLNLKTIPEKNGSLTVGGSFTADDGQMFLVDEGSVLSDNIKLYADNEGEDVEYDINSEPFTKEFCYDASKAKFMFRGVGGGDDNLYDFDLRVHYNQDQSLITYTCGTNPPQILRDSDRTQFNAAGEGEPPEVGAVSFNIDLNKNFEDRDLADEEKITYPSISILKISYPRDAEPTEEWIVRSNASTNGDYAFVGNNLTFTPADETPFELIICLDEAEYNYVTYEVPDDKILVEYVCQGNGEITLSGAENVLTYKNRNKALLPKGTENAVFTYNSEDRFEEFVVDGRFYRVDDMPRDGITYNDETSELTVPLFEEQNEYYVELVFFGDEPHDQREFQVVYTPDKFEVQCTNGESTFELFDHGRDRYPEDMMVPPYITITPKDSYSIKGLLVFTYSGEDYYVNSTALEDGNKFTFVNTDIRCVQIIANDETGINYFIVRYNKDITDVSKNGSVLNEDQEYYFAKNSEMAFNTYGVDPYKVIVRVGIDNAYDITDLYADGYLKYTPTDNFPRSFEFYFTKAEYECMAMNPEEDRNVVELMTWGGGNIEVYGSDGNLIPENNIVNYGNRCRVALPNEDTFITVKLNPFTGQSVENVRLEGVDQPADSYTGNTFRIDVERNRGFINCEFNFTNNSAENFGVFGENIFWEYDASTKTLTVKGSGKIPDFYNGSFSDLRRPWENYINLAEHIVVEKGITSIGSCAFYRAFYAKTVSLPEGLLTINEFAFMSIVAETLDIPEGVIKIGRQAFQNISTLKTLNLPSSVSNISPNTFSETKNLENINVAKGNKTFHSTGNCLINTEKKVLILGCKNSVIPTDGSVTSIGARAFYGSNIESLVIPSQITSIDEHVFTYSRINNVIIPNTVDTIKSNSFSYCSYLKTIYIPASVTTVKQYAFANTALTNVYYCGTVAQWDAINIDVLGNETLSNATRSYHKPISGYTTDDANHWQVCEICGEILGKEKHNFVSGVCTVCGQKAPKVNFPDVDYNAWYGDAIEYAVAAGLMKGYGSGKFGTADGIQRQDFVVILSRLSGDDLSEYEGKPSFKDVPTNAYYATALAWAKAVGVSSGYANGKFGVGDKVTREQIMTFLYNYAKLKGYGIAVTDEQKAAIRAQYSDFNTVSGYAQEATYWALSKGVISGKDAGGGKKLIAPKANAQRCEVAAMFYNIDQKNIFNPPV